MFGKKDSGRFLNGFVSKKTRKTVGWGMIILSILLAIPPLIPSPDDFLNLILVQWMVGYGLAVDIAFVATYTVIPFALFTAGIYIFPASDGSIYKKARKKFSQFYQIISL